MNKSIRSILSLYAWLDFLNPMMHGVRSFDDDNEFDEYKRKLPGMAFGR